MTFFAAAGWKLNQPMYPLNEMVSPQRSYFGVPGGLYGNWSNTIPAGHDAALLAQAALVEPLDAAGSPDAGGAIVIASWGQSNPRREFDEFETNNFDLNRAAWGVAAAVDCLNLGIEGTPSQDWADADGAVWATSVPALVAASAYTADQIQVLWTNLARDKANDRRYLPDANPEYLRLARDMADALRQWQIYAPNVRLAFFSNLYYGWAPINNRTHKKANYEVGLAVRELIIAQAAGDNSTYGNLTIGTVPAVAWGPLTYDGPDYWTIDYYQADNPNHLDPTIGEPRISAALETHFRNSAYSIPWFIGVASAVLVEDTFTDTNGTAIASHTPDTNTPGNAWVNATIQGAAGGTFPTIQGNQLQLNQSNRGAVIDVEDTDVYIEVDWTPAVAADNRVRLMLRYQDGSNHIGFRLRENSADAALFTHLAAVDTTIDSAAGLTLTEGVTYRLRFEVSGNDYIGSIDGTPVATGTIADLAANTSHGVMHNGGAATHLLDNLEIGTT